MAEKVIRLVTSTEPPCKVDEGVVKALEEMLAGAKAGKFNGFMAITISCPNVGHYESGDERWAGSVVDNGYAALGVLALMQHNFLVMMAGGSPPPDGEVTA